MNTLQVQVTNESDWANAITLDRSAWGIDEIMGKFESECSSRLVGIEAVTYDALGRLEGIIGLKAQLHAKNLEEMAEAAWKAPDSSENELMGAWFECLLLSQKPFLGQNEFQLGIFNEWFDSGVVTLDDASREAIYFGGKRPKWLTEGSELPIIIEQNFPKPLKHWRSKIVSYLRDGRHYLGGKYVEEFVAANKSCEESKPGKRDCTNRNH